VNNLNAAYSSLSTRRRYEVWFIRLGLADGEGAWWFRYLLMNPARGGCSLEPRGMPVQIWATWFPREGEPRTFIQGFPLQGLDFTPPSQVPFHFRIGKNAIGENSCCGALDVDGHAISWELQYRSTFGGTLSDKGWIGFSRTPHSDAVFSGHVTLDGHTFSREPLGFGVQGHNCGYRHRSSWTWAHAHFASDERRPSTFEALMYDMPFGLFFRKAVLWHDGQQFIFRNQRQVKRDRENLLWEFRCESGDGVEMKAEFDGRGTSVHRLPYVKTNCTGTLDVANNSLCRAKLSLKWPNKPQQELETAVGAVLEMGGR